VTRWLPFPLQSAALLGAWLLLNQSLSAGQVLIGCALAVLVPRLTAALQRPAVRVRRPRAMVALAVLFLTEVVRSNIAVARIVLGEGRRHQTSAFIRIPLELRDPHGLALFACIITATPGTLWVSFHRGVLMIHVLDLIDERAWVDLMKDRYERLLREIFE
jgi:multicomponent K+:H+ antiporter subunit E